MRHFENSAYVTNKEAIYAYDSTFWNFLIANFKMKVALALAASVKAGRMNYVIGGNIVEAHRDRLYESTIREILTRKKIAQKF